MDSLALTHQSHQFKESPKTSAYKTYLRRDIFERHARPPTTQTLMGQKAQITAAELKKRDEKDLEERVTKASEEVNKILKKLELGIGATPHFSQVQGSPSFVVTTQIQFFSTRQAAVREKLAEA